MTPPYTKKLIKRFQNPKFIKNLKNPDGIGEVGNIYCGDIMHLEIKVSDGKIKDIGFKTFGCGSAIASSSLATEWMKGKTIDECLEIKDSDIYAHLSLPPIKKHCSMLAEDGIRAAIHDYKEKQSKLQKQ